MSVLKEISLAIIKQEINDCKQDALISNLQYSILNEENLSFIVEMSSPIDGNLFIIKFILDNYKEMPPYIQFIDPITGEINTAQAYPLGHDSFFHKDKQSICNPCSRRSYPGYANIHGDWNINSWKENPQVNSLTDLKSIIKAIYIRISKKEYYKGRMTESPLVISKRRFTPPDNMKYVISSQVIRDTERVLKEYGQLTPSHEGLVFWGGIISDNLVQISLVIAPHTDSSSGHVMSDNRSNFDVVRKLSEQHCVHIGQVHSHPGSWVDHSFGDDKQAAFKSNGLISIVVPNYCSNPLLSLSNCGVHRYDDGEFKRFSDEYVINHFEISDKLASNFIDLRH